MTGRAVAAPARPEAPESRPTEARLIARKPSAQIVPLLGYANGPEMIHRDNLVLR